MISFSEVKTVCGRFNMCLLTQQEMFIRSVSSRVPKGTGYCIEASDLSYANGHCKQIVNTISFIHPPFQLPVSPGHNILCSIWNSKLHM